MRTVANAVVIDSTYTVPMHCTGEIFIHEFMRLMAQKNVRL
jgi:7,8-dihydropterin-6-yl-methyl-4-(beta-D-ribofuranosyl)aminobenzene 5'-phosphate synthase